MGDPEHEIKFGPEWLRNYGRANVPNESPSSSRQIPSTFSHMGDDLASERSTYHSSRGGSYGNLRGGYQNARGNNLRGGVNNNRSSFPNQRGYNNTNSRGTFSNQRGGHLSSRGAYISTRGAHTGIRGGGNNIMRTGYAVGVAGPSGTGAIPKMTNVHRGGLSTRSCGSTSRPPNRQPPMLAAMSKVSLAKLRYGREEMLALYENEIEPVPDFKSYHILYSKKRAPIALNNNFEEQRDNFHVNQPTNNPSGERFGGRRPHTNDRTQGRGGSTSYRQLDSRWWRHGESSDMDSNEWRNTRRMPRDRWAGRDGGGNREGYWSHNLRSNHDDNYPEWATESPDNRNHQAGTFDSDGAFHGNNSSDDLALSDTPDTDFAYPYMQRNSMQQSPTKENVNMEKQTTNNNSEAMGYKNLQYGSGNAQTAEGPPALSSPTDKLEGNDLTFRQQHQNIVYSDDMVTASTSVTSLLKSNPPVSTNVTQGAQTSFHVPMMDADLFTLKMNNLSLGYNAIENNNQYETKSNVQSGSIGFGALAPHLNMPSEPIVPNTGSRIQSIENELLNSALDSMLKQDTTPVSVSTDPVTSRLNTPIINNGIRHPVNTNFTMTPALPPPGLLHIQGIHAANTQNTLLSGIPNTSNNSGMLTSPNLFPFQRGIQNINDAQFLNNSMFVGNPAMTLNTTHHGQEIQNLPNVYTIPSYNLQHSGAPVVNNSLYSSLVKPTNTGLNTQHSFNQQAEGTADSLYSNMIHQPNLHGFNQQQQPVMTNSSLFMNLVGQPISAVPAINHSFNLQQLEGLPLPPSSSLYTATGTRNTNYMYSADQWLYLDPKGDLQGPFSSNQMYDWFQSGFLSPLLKVRRTFETELTTLWTLGPRPPFAPINLPKGTHSEQSVPTNKYPVSTLMNSINTMPVNAAAPGVLPVAPKPQEHIDYHTVNRVWSNQPQNNRDFENTSPWGISIAEVKKVDLNAQKMESNPILSDMSSVNPPNENVPSNILQELKSDAEVLVPLQSPPPPIETSECSDLQNTPVENIQLSVHTVKTLQLKTKDSLIKATNITEQKLEKKPQALEETNISSQQQEVKKVTENNSNAVQNKGKSETKQKKLKVENKEKNKIKEVSSNKTKNKKNKDEKKMEVVDVKPKEDSAETEQVATPAAQASLLNKNKARMSPWAMIEQSSNQEVRQPNPRLVPLNENTPWALVDQSFMQQDIIQMPKIAPPIIDNTPRGTPWATVNQDFGTPNIIQIPQRPGPVPVPEKPTKTAPWASMVNQDFENFNIDGPTSFAEIIRLERESKLSQMREEQMLHMMTQQRAKLAREQELQSELNWARRDVSSVFSPNHFSEAQTEAKMKAPVAGSSAHPDSNAFLGTVRPGFWETGAGDMNNEDDNDNLEQSPTNSATPEVVDPVNRTKPIKPSAPTSQGKTKKKGKTGTIKPNVSTSPLGQFEAWCNRALESWSSNLDVPTFIGFLKDLESPDEIKEYINFYLGETMESSDFARQFLERRSKYYRISIPPPVDDLCAPAAAINPHSNIGADHYDFKNKNKKPKKNRMNKIDCNMLGFSSTASEDRFNKGEIDSMHRS